MAWIAFCALLLASPQEKDVEELKKKVLRLETTVDELKDELEQLQEERLEEKETGSETQQSANLLNPQITVFLNGAARIDDQIVTTGGHHGPGEEIHDNLYLRGAELDFRAAVDPYVDGVLILGVHPDPGEHFEAGIEEGYGIIKRLPLLETAPLGMRLKAGRYRAPLGRTNLLHGHDYPWTTAPLPVARYLGTEHGEFFDSGYAMEGAGLMLPIPSLEGTALDLEVHVARAGEIAFMHEHEHPDQPAAVVHLGFFTKLGEEHDLSLGVSGYGETGRLDGKLAAADFLYRWRPTGHFNSIVIGGEGFYVSRELDHEGGLETNTPFGYFLFTQFQATARAYLGVRYDSVQCLEHDEDETSVAAAYLSYYTSEFFRIRFGYEHRWSDDLHEDDLDSFFIELNFVFGSHPPEPWWVNR